jgi:hypothetical protein
MYVMPERRNTDTALHRDTATFGRMNTNNDICKPNKRKNVVSYKSVILLIWPSGMMSSICIGPIN